MKQADKDWYKFEKWWDKHGQFCYSGGGEREKRWAWVGWKAVLDKKRKRGDQ